jgi:hypothetical protein
MCCCNFKINLIPLFSRLGDTSYFIPPSFTLETWISYLQFHFVRPHSAYGFAILSWFPLLAQKQKIEGLNLIFQNLKSIVGCFLIKFKSINTERNASISSCNERPIKS